MAKMSYRHLTVLDCVLISGLELSISPAAAFKTYTRMLQRACGFNDLRVTSCEEYLGWLGEHPDATGRAVWFRGVLAGVFERQYAFDLEHWRALPDLALRDRLLQLPGVTPPIARSAIQKIRGSHMGLAKLFGKGKKRESARQTKAVR